MLALNRMKRIAFATSQDQKWTLSSWKLPDCSRQLSFKGKLYVAAKNSSLRDAQFLQIDPPAHPHDGAASDLASLLPAPKLIATCPTDKLKLMPIYLVESELEILVVGNNLDPESSLILVHRLSDLVSGRYTPLKSIGDNSIFIDTTTLCVSAKALPTVVCDTVVHISAYNGAHSGYVAEYHLGNGTLSRVLDECGLDGLPPSPYTLIRHIFTYCFHMYWHVLLPPSEITRRRNE